MPHIATKLGIKRDEEFKRAYWTAFDHFLGAENSRLLKTMILARTPKGDTGKEDIDRICYGLRTTIPWLADAIEKSALGRRGRGTLAERTVDRVKDTTGNEPEYEKGGHEPI